MCPSQPDLDSSCRSLAVTWQLWLFLGFARLSHLYWAVYILLMILSSLFTQTALLKRRPKAASLPKGRLWSTRSVELLQAMLLSKRSCVTEFVVSSPSRVLAALLLVEALLLQDSDEEESPGRKLSQMVDLQLPRGSNEWLKSRFCGDTSHQGGSPKNDYAASTDLVWKWLLKYQSGKLDPKKSSSWTQVSMKQHYVSPFGIFPAIVTNDCRFLL